MIQKFHGIVLIVAWIYVCQGRHVGNLECPKQFYSCPCGNLTKDEVGGVKRCSEQSVIFCFLDKNCNTSSKLCLNCPKKGTTLCKECCCKRSIRNSSLDHTINRRQAGDQMVCSKPVDPEYGKAIYEADEFAVGEVVKYRCREGYALIGSVIRHCNGNGKWAGEIPTCEKLCSFPPINSQDGLSYVENPGRTESLRDSKGNVVLSEIEFKCDSGFSLIGPGRIRCLAGEGRWDLDPPKCDCSCHNNGTCAPDGSRICQNGFVGNNCKVVIQRQEKSLRRRRQGSDSPGGCQVYPPPDNGNFHLESKNPKAGDAIKYTCNENFTMMGSRTRHCSGNGRWSGEAPTCEKMCPFPAVTQHVKVQVNPYLLGAPLHDSFGTEVLAELEFSCASGYTLVGAQRVRCASGIWDQQIPYCRLSSGCDDPGFPENGHKNQPTTSTNGYGPGNQISFVCDPNHALVGSPKITCLPTGKWSSPMPSCIPQNIPMCVFTCKSQEIQAKLHQLDGPLVCNAKGVENLQEGSILLTPEK